MNGDRKIPSVSQEILAGYITALEKSRRCHVLHLVLQVMFMAVYSGKYITYLIRAGMFIKGNIRP